LRDQHIEWLQGFNPRPARGPGAAWGRSGGGTAGRDVSILAQPGGRALLCYNWG